MKIVVCVKYCPDAQAERRFAADNTTERADVDGVLSELDEYAVEQALTIAEDGDAEVIALAVRSLRDLGIDRISVDLAMPTLVGEIVAELGGGEDFTDQRTFKARNTFGKSHGSHR